MKGYQYSIISVMASCGAYLIAVRRGDMQRWQQGPRCMRCHKILTPEQWRVTCQIEAPCQEEAMRLYYQNVANVRSLMIKHMGGLGDNVFSIPGLIALRPYFRTIYLACRPAAAQIFENTGLIDGFLEWPMEYDAKIKEIKKRIREDKVSDDDKLQLWKRMEEYKTAMRKEIEKRLDGIEFDTSIDLHGVIPDRFLWHEGSEGFDRDVFWRRKQNMGVNYYDEMSKRMGVFPQAPKLPIFVKSEQERAFLHGFRERFQIPKDKRLLVWQFIGSGRIKWYPMFQDVAVELLKRYPDLMILGTGGPDVKPLQWKTPQYRNLSELSFREVCCVISMADLLISPETGVFNMAGAFDTPKILLATHTDGTQIAGHFTRCKILRSGAACAPCYQVRYDCPRKAKGKPWPLCMDWIHPSLVVEAAKEVLG